MNKGTASVFIGGLLLFCVFTILFPFQAIAQFGASISGTVIDPSGAVIPKAKVTLKNQQTQATQTTTSSPQGFYRFGSLGPGTYTITSETQGFQPQTIDNVGVVAETPRNLDIHMTPTGATQSVTVNANQIPLLQTADASIGSTINSQQVTRLPIFGRDPYELVRTAVGTTADAARSGTGGSVFLPNGSGPGQSNFGIFQTENQIQVSAAGQRVTSNSYLIDGVSVDSLQHGGAAIITPNPESVAQIATTTTSYDAGDGRNVGAQIKTVTKSGTNEVHGSLFFQYDDPGLNAFQRYGGPNGALPQRVQNKQREWAGSIGFPILKNKLFFFGSYEGVKNTNAAYSQQYVIAAPYRAYLQANRSNGIVNGILNGTGGQPRIVKILPVKSANFDLCTNLVGGSQTQCQYVGAGANVGAFNGGVGTYTNQMGGATSASTLDGIEDIDYAQIITPERFRANQFNGRIDWNITPRDLFAASVFFTKLSQTSGDPATGAQPISDLPFKPLNQSGTLVYIHTFNSTLVNEARANYTRFSDNQIQDSKGLVNWGVPQLKIQGYKFGNLISGADSAQTTPGIFAETTYEVRDTLTKVFGSHTLRIGGQFRWEQDNDNLNGLARPVYAFQGIYNLANDTPIYEQVAANPNTAGVPNAQRYFRDHDFAGFVQHDWKVTPNLTLNTGLRYEFFSPLANKGLPVYLPRLTSTAGYELINASLQPANHLWNGNYNNWAPKLGLAWTPPRFNNKMVLRAGVGSLYDRLDDILFINTYQNGPGYFVYNLCCASSTTTPQSVGISFGLGSSDSPYSYTNSPLLATGINPATNTPNAVTGLTTPTIDVYGAFSRTKQPVIYVYSLETQYELPYQSVLTIGYQGSVGHHFPRLVDQNFLYQTCIFSPGSTACDPTTNPHTPFSNAYVPTTDVFTNYNALNIHYSKQYSKGFTLDAIYTYAKSMDQSSNEGPGALSNQTDPAHPRTEYGPSDFDVRHRVTISGLWDLPKYHGGHGLAGQVLSGWQMNGIYTWHTGFPWTPVTGVPSVQYVQSANTISPTRPIAYYGGAGNSCSNSSYIHGTNFAGGGTKYFNISTSGPPGIGRNSWNGPCYMDTDMSFAKQQTFSVLHHESQLRFQANFYNIFNQTNLSPITFGADEAHIENTLFGLAPGADAGRVVEFLMRLQF